jgi:hypothetical protein
MNESDLSIEKKRKLIAYFYRYGFSQDYISETFRIPKELLSKVLKTKDERSSDHLGEIEVTTLQQGI